MADDALKFVIEGTEYSVDTDFKLGELEWLEEFVGRPLTNENAMNSIKAAVGLIYLVKLREDPSYTVEQARGLNMTALQQPESEKPAAKRPPKPAARA